MDMWSYMLGTKRGGGSGGGADWNAPEGTAGYIKNRTHYEEVTEVMGDTLTWDGNTEGLVSVSAAGMNLYKISDVVPTKDDFANGIIVTMKLPDGTEMPMEVEGSAIQSVVRDDGCFGIETLIFGIPTDNYLLVPSMGASIQFEKAGLYFMLADGAYASEFKINGYTGFKTVTTTVKPLDEKYMPILTSPSGKKFKLTVDDSGTVSAVEVTE